MTELLRKLLASTAMFAPDTGGGVGGDDDILDDDLVEGDEEGDGEGDEPVLEAEQDDDADDEGAGEPEPPKPSRGEKRFQTLANELKAEREARARLERDMEAIRQERTQNNTRTSEAEEAERLAMMTLEERVEYKLNKALEQQTRTTRLMQFQAQDAQDKATFEGRYRAHPKYGAYCDEVEAELSKSRAAGVNVSREIVLAALIGQKVLANGGTTAKPAKRLDAQRRMKANTTQPADTRGGEATGRRGGKSLEDRLDGLTF